MRTAGVNPWRTCRGRAISARPNPSANPVGGCRSPPRPASGRRSRFLAPRTLPGLRRAAFAVLVAALAVIVSAFLAPAPAQADPSLGSLAEQVEQQGRELDVVMEQYNEGNVLLNRTQNQLADVKAQIPRLTAQLDNAAATVRSVASNAYRGSVVSGVSAVLSAGSPTDLIERLDTLDVLRSEERRVGKEGRSRWSPCRSKK